MHVYKFLKLLQLLKFLWSLCIIKVVDEKLPVEEVTPGIQYGRLNILLSGD